ncbi:MAG: DUF1064 domain-containing protein [Muribaculaceae bacterium]|nr:DUF1064 domain-containing protein [Muribaculaceae bacterium]
MTAAQFNAAVKQLRTRQPTKRSKYGNCRVDGYDSLKEKRRGLALMVQERAGRIYDLQRQVRFELVPPMLDKNGKIQEHGVSYIADFVYHLADTGKLIVEDVKGMKTEVYKIKRKLMRHIYGIIIKET